MGRFICTFESNRPAPLARSPAPTLPFAAYLLTSGRGGAHTAKALPLDCYWLLHAPSVLTLGTRLSLPDC
jgi:hypothetical protein